MTSMVIMVTTDSITSAPTRADESEKGIYSPQSIELIGTERTSKATKTNDFLKSIFFWFILIIAERIAQPPPKQQSKYLKWFFALNSCEVERG